MYIHDSEYWEYNGQYLKKPHVAIDREKNLSHLDLSKMTDRELKELEIHLLIDICERLGRIATYQR